MVSYLVNKDFWLCLSERFHFIDEKNVDPEIEKIVDIGFPHVRTESKSLERKERMALIKSQRQMSDLEKQARNQTRN